MIKPEEMTGPMRLALEEARRASQRGEVPVGAVIVNPLSKEVIAMAGNRIVERHDPTAHAEMLAIQAASQRRGGERLSGMDMYVTLEPCPMCAQAISFARIRRLYFGATDFKGGGVENGPKIFSQSTCHHRPDVYGGIDENQSSALLRDFFRGRR